MDCKYFPETLRANYLDFFYQYTGNAKCRAWIYLLSVEYYVKRKLFTFPRNFSMIDYVGFQLIIFRWLYITTEFT